MHRDYDKITIENKLDKLLKDTNLTSLEKMDLKLFVTDTLDAISQENINNYREGHEEGRYEGYDDGYEAGESDGKSEGYDRGKRHANTTHRTTMDYELREELRP